MRRAEDPYYRIVQKGGLFRVHQFHRWWVFTWWTVARQNGVYDDWPAEFKSFQAAQQWAHVNMIDQPTVASPSRWRELKRFY